MAPCVPTCVNGSRHGERADCVLALGTSLSGMNADQLARGCADRHAAAGSGAVGGLIIVGLQATELDKDATVRIWGLLDEVLPLLANELRITVPCKSAAAAGKLWDEKHPRCFFRTPKRKPTDPV